MKSLDKITSEQLLQAQTIARSKFVQDWVPILQYFEEADSQEPDSDKGLDFGLDLSEATVKEFNIDSSLVPITLRIGRHIFRTREEQRSVKT